jgi:hypothetical protein
MHFLQGFNQHCRDLVANYPPNNLPRWLRVARIRYGRINDSLIAIFDDGVDRDEYSNLGNIDSDVVAIFTMDDFLPTTVGLHIPTGQYPIIMEGEVSDGGLAIIDLRDVFPLYLDCGHHRHHFPVMLATLFFQYNPLGQGIRSARFVPFALYIHQQDIEDTGLWQRLDVHLAPHFRHVNLDLGPFYAARQQLTQVFGTTVESTVIVCGRDSQADSLN